MGVGKYVYIGHVYRFVTIQLTADMRREKPADWLFSTRFLHRFTALRSDTYVERFLSNQSCAVVSTVL